MLNLANSSPLEQVMTNLIAKRGVKVGNTWRETCIKVGGQAIAQLSRKKLKPATVRKWHELAGIVGAGKMVLDKIRAKATQAPKEQAA